MPPKSRPKKQPKFKGESTDLILAEENTIEDAQKRRDEFIKQNLYDSDDVLYEKYVDFFNNDKFYSQYADKKDAIISGREFVLSKQKELQRIEDKENKKKAEDREREFFIIHRVDDDEDILEEYKIFAKKDKYYKNMFTEEKPPTLEYINSRKIYYYKKFDMSEIESANEFLLTLRTEKNPYVLKQKFMDYIDSEDVDQIFKTKFKGTKLSPVGIKYMIEKYLKDTEGSSVDYKKKYADNKQLLSLLQLTSNQENLKDVIRDYIKPENFGKDFSPEVIRLVKNIINSELTNEDIITMLNQYLKDNEVESTIYFQDYYKEYLSQYRENLPEFKEEEKIKKFLRSLVKAIKLFESGTLSEKKKNALWFKILNHIKKFKDDPDAPESRNIIFDKFIKKLSNSEDFVLYSKVIREYLLQYYELRQGKIKTFKNFEDFLNDFIIGLESPTVTPEYFQKIKELGLDVDNFGLTYLERKELEDKRWTRTQGEYWDKERESKELALMRKFDDKPEIIEPPRIINKEVLSFLEKEDDDRRKKIESVKAEVYNEIYNEESTEYVKNDIVELCRKKLSDALLKVADLPEYTLNSPYINRIMELNKSKSANTYEFIKNIATFVVYLSNEVNNIVRFNYYRKMSKGLGVYTATNNSLFLSNIKNLFYLPEVFINLTPNNMLNNAFYDETIPKEKRETILYGIDKIIENTIEEYAKTIINKRNLFDIKNIHKRTYKIPSKNYFQYEISSIDPVYLEKLYIDPKSSYKYLVFEDESQNFEEDYVFYNEEYTKQEDLVYKDGSKQQIPKTYSDVYKFKNKDLWNIIQSGVLLNPESKRVLNADFIKEFTEVYLRKKQDKEEHENKIKKIEEEQVIRNVEEAKFVEELPDLLSLLNEELKLIKRGNIKKEEDAGETIPEQHNPVEKENLISVIINKDKKSYFVILNKDGKNPIKYIYNIHDNILEEIPDKSLITDKNNVLEEMEKQKSLDPNNFYTLLYFKKMEPTFQSDHNDHELILESLKDMKNDIISKSKQNIDMFLNDVFHNSSYSTIDDVNKLKIVFDDNNNTLISFEDIEPQQLIKEQVTDTDINISTNSDKKYIGFMYEYTDGKNVNRKNLVIFTKEGFYISSVYDINNEDFIDKDEERGILKSDILVNDVDIKKQLAPYKNNIYSAIYLKTNKLLPCSDDLLKKYLEDITKNKDMKGKGNAEKYTNELDNSLGVDMSKIEIDIDSKNIPNFKYNGTDVIENNNTLPLNIIKDSVVSSDSDKDSVVSSDSDKDSVVSSDSDKDSVASSDSDKDSVVSSDSNKDSVVSSDSNKDSVMSSDGGDKKKLSTITCVNCKKENVPKENSLKSIVTNKDNGFDEIYFCSFPCFEKYDVWPTLKKIKK